jgi:glycosyltransferase involved in cell wall biosynthesis
MKPFISFIIPVYNVEQYLTDCFDSIIVQPDTDIEIVIINDGSTDKSTEICNNYALKDERIKLIHKKNEGLGYARNTGLETASGDYIAFLDSDDWVSKDIVRSIKKILQNRTIQLLEFGLVQVGADNKRTGLKLPRIKSGSYSGDQIYNDILPNFLSDRNERISNSVCNHIYRREIIERNKIRFFNEREIFTEDFLFTIQYLLCVDNLTVTDEVHYYYRYNQDSLTKVYRENYLELVLKRDNILREILTSKGLLDRYEQFILDKFIRISPSFIFNSLRLGKSVPRSEVTNEIENILNNPVVVDSFKKLDYKKLPVKKWPIYLLIRHRKAGLIFILLRFIEGIRNLRIIRRLLFIK